MTNATRRIENNRNNMSALLRLSLVANINLLFTLPGVIGFLIVQTKVLVSKKTVELRRRTSETLAIYQFEADKGKLAPVASL